MPQFLCYGDAMALLSEIDVKLGQRVIHPKTLYYLPIELNVNQYLEKPLEKDMVLMYTVNQRSYAYDDYWAAFYNDEYTAEYCLARDESQEAFEERVARCKAIKADIEQYRGDASNAKLKVWLPVYQVKQGQTFSKVTDLVSNVRKQIALHSVGDKFYLYPSDIRDIVLFFLKKGSEQQNGYLCDHPIKTLSTLFYKPKQYYGNDFINELLQRYQLTEDSDQHIDSFPLLNEQRITELNALLKKATEAKKAIEKNTFSGRLKSLFK